MKIKEKNTKIYFKNPYIIFSSGFFGFFSDRDRHLNWHNTRSGVAFQQMNDLTMIFCV
jgi:hypothetical protein